MSDNGHDRGHDKNLEGTSKDEQSSPVAQRGTGIIA